MCQAVTELLVGLLPSFSTLPSQEMSDTVWALHHAMPHWRRALRRWRLAREVKRPLRELVKMTQALLKPISEEYGTMLTPADHQPSSPTEPEGPVDITPAD